MGIRKLISEAQVLVVGAGPSGLMSAKIANEYGYKVLLLDAGDNKSNRYSSVLDQNSRPFPSAGIGGAAKHWGAQCALPSSENLRVWAEVVGTNNSYLSEIYDSIIGVSKFLKLEINLENKYFQDEIEKYSKLFKTKHSIYLSSQDLTNFFTTTLNSINYQENFRVEKFFSDEKSVIEIQINGEIFDVSNKSIIISCGTIATTELVNISIHEGQRRNYNLQDHPYGYVASLEGKNPAYLNKAQIRKYKGSEFKRKFEITSELGDRSGILEFHLDISGELWKSYGIPLINSPKRGIRTLINRIMFRLWGRIIFRLPFIHAWVQIEQEKQPYLSCENGIASSNWKLSKLDIEFLALIQAEIFKVSESMGLKLVWRANLEKGGSTHFSDAFHPSGTLTSHSSSANSDVDEYGRIHGLDNLIINSAATWPVSGWFNPTFFLMCIADLNTRKLLS